MYKLGIIGFGGMAGVHCSELERGELPITVKGVFDIAPDRMEAARARGYVCYESREALLADEDIDIVLIAVPNHLHRDFSIEAMRAGKHVLCEKPVTVTSAELYDIMTVAAETGRIFTINHNRRINKDFVLVRRTIDSGELGKPYLIESRVEGSRGIPEGWRTDKAQGGGMMLDWGVHLIDQILYMLDERVTSVHCHMLSINYDGVDDDFRLTLTLSSGVIVRIEVATNSFISHPRWYVFGTDGTMVLDDMLCHGRIVKPTSRENEWDAEIAPDRSGPTKTMAARDPSTLVCKETEKPTDVEKGLTPTYAQMLRAIEGTAPLSITAEQAMRVMKVIECAFESARTNTVIHTDI